MRKLIFAFSMLALLVAACAPQTVEVEVTREVEVEVAGETVVETVVEEVEVEVTRVVEVEVEAEAAMLEELVVAIAAEPPNLDSWRGSSETNGPGIRNVIEQLVARNIGAGRGVFAPMLATSWEYIEPNTVQFTLREGVMFHDGSPFNAESAAYSLNYLFNPDNATNFSTNERRDYSAEAVGEYTLNFTTNTTSGKPDPIIIELVETIAISSAKQLQDDPDSWSTFLIGTGPYKFVAWNRGESLEFEANHDWWGIDAPEEALGAIGFEKVTYRFILEAEVRVAGVLAGEVHLAQFITPDQCDEIGRAPGARCAQAQSVETIIFRQDTHSSLMLRDVRVRRALQLALDKPLIIETILGGGGTLASQIINPTALGYDPTIVGIPFDPDLAMSLLAEAAAEGVPVDMPIELAVRQGVFPNAEELLQAVAGFWRNVGLEVNTAVLSVDRFNENYGLPLDDTPEDRNYIAMHQHGNEALDFFFSYAYYGCGFDVSQYCVPEQDAMMAEAAQKGGAEREAALQEINRLLMDDVVIGYLAHLDLIYAVNDALDWTLKLDHRLIAKEMAPMAPAG